MNEVIVYLHLQPFLPLKIVMKNYLFDNLSNIQLAVFKVYAMIY